MTETVSIVVTVRDEERTIDELLASIAGQTRSPDEVVIVDGGSRDGTARAVARARAGDDRIRLLEAPETTIAAGRNAGIHAARGQIVAVTDAGTWLDPSWLDRLVRTLESDPQLAVASGFFAPGGRTWFERLLSTIITPHPDEISPERFLPSSRSIAFRREWWSRVGGYPEWLRHCEDLVFDLELRRAGARFAFVPDALVSWAARPSLAAFYRQYFAYARGDGHARLWPKRHLVRYSAYATGLGLLLAGRRRRAWWLLLGLGISAHLAKPYRRLAARPPFADVGRRGASAALLPVVVVTGDVAKMIGYPVGRIEGRKQSVAGRPSNDRNG